VTVAIYMDHHVKAEVTAGLRRREVDVLTVFEDGTHELDDDLLLQRATELGRVLFTQDEDFLRIAKYKQRVGHEFAGVVYGHQLGISIGEAISDLELIAKIYEPEAMRNRIEYLPL
jgi:hypothetical protein